MALLRVILIPLGVVIGGTNIAAILPVTRAGTWVVWTGLADSQLHAGTVRSNIAAFPLDGAPSRPTSFNFVRVIVVAAFWIDAPAALARGVGHIAQRLCNRIRSQFISVEPTYSSGNYLP